MTNYAIIGLGNPGPKYAKTRHNIGFMILDELAQEHHAAWHTHQEYATAETTIVERTVLLITPLTGMNNSGIACGLLKRKGITPDRVLVVHDELELPFQKIIVRQGGSAKGHNGLRSLISQCGSDFYRLRCGIGRPDNREDVPDFVLNNFTPDEREDLYELISRATTLIEEWLEKQSA